MGTINYGSNDYFNIGVNPNNYWIEDENGENIFLNWELEEDYTTIEKLLNNYIFDYFKVTIQPGYYEGFYIDISFDYLWVDYWEKPEILKELTQLKNFLINCVYSGMVEYYPGWCTGYSDTTKTFQAIKDRIKELKQDLKKFPTYKTRNKVVTIW